MAQNGLSGGWLGSSSNNQIYRTSIVPQSVKLTDWHEASVPSARTSTKVSSRLNMVDEQSYSAMFSEETQ